MTDEKIENLIKNDLTALIKHLCLIPRRTEKDYQTIDNFMKDWLLIKQTAYELHSVQNELNQQLERMKIEQANKMNDILNELRLIKRR